MKSHGYAAHDNKSPLAPYTFERRDPGPRDVVVEIDLLRYLPLRHPPGAQRVGRLDVSHGPRPRDRRPRHGGGRPGHPLQARRPGRRRRAWSTPAASAPTARPDLENYCVRKASSAPTTPAATTARMVYGGYSNNIVCDQRYVHSISPKLQRQARRRRASALRRHHHLLAAAPLEARAPATRSASSAWAASGHMGLKFAHAFGAHVVQFTTSTEQDRRRPKRLGADEVVISKDPDAMASHAASFDFILDCVSAPHDLNAYLEAAAPRRHALPRRPRGGASFPSRRSPSPPSASRSPAPTSAA